MRVVLVHVLAGGLVLAGCSHAEVRGAGVAKAVRDSREINTAVLWPKPANPVAPGSERIRSIEVVQRFFEAYGKEDLAGIRAVMHEDVEWHIPGHHALSGTKRGIDEVTAFFGQLQKAGFRSEVMIVAANDRYVIDAHRGWSNSGKGDIDLNWVLLYQVEDGKIRRVQNFSGDLYASDEFFDRFYGR